jgi:hypothetical protein
MLVKKYWFTILLGRKLFDKEYENTGSFNKKHSVAAICKGYLFIDGY